MQTFEFYLDRKVTQWYRELHYLEANSLEEARSKMIELFLEDDTSDTFDCQDAINDTWGDLTPEENNGNPTAELYCGESETLLIDNVAKIPQL
jgi:hypothetical protein